jgi:GNAT superfamily N-acetyltransferase
VNIRRLKREEGLKYREIRLRALRDSPDAFGTTFTEAEAKPPQWFIDRARELDEQPDRWGVLIACDDDDAFHGMLYAAVSSESPSTMEVFGMWTDPALRRQRIAASLIDAVVSWAKRLGLNRIELWVTEGNDAAIGFYNRVKFRDTGETDLLRPNRTTRIRKMVRDLIANG